MKIISVMLAIWVSSLSCESEPVGGVAGDDGAVGELGFKGVMPIYDDIWQSMAYGETRFKINGLQIWEQDQISALIGKQDGGRVEFTLSRNTSDELRAEIYVYDAQDALVGSAVRNYGIGKHTGWGAYEDNDTYGNSSGINRRRGDTYAYTLRPSVNNQVATRGVHAQEGVAASDMFSSLSFAVPADGLVLMHSDSERVDLCAEVKVKLPGAQAYETKQPTRFLSMDGGEIEDDDQLFVLYQQCLARRL